jgi:hypothetical protein
MEKHKAIIVKNVSTGKIIVDTAPRSQAVDFINQLNKDMEHPELKAAFTTKGKLKRIIKNQRPRFTAFSNGGSPYSGLNKKRIARKGGVGKSSMIRKVQWIPVFKEDDVRNSANFKRNPHYNGNNAVFNHLFHIVGWNKIVHFPNAKGHISA